MTTKTEKKASEILQRCRQAELKIATAESCTGGLIAAAFTEIAGSSDVFERGFVTYSNEAKEEMLSVDANLINSEGAVSEAVARAMAEGALAQSHAHLSIAVTGIAGPGGGNVEKPVGMVHLAAALRGHPTLHHELGLGAQTRHEIRQQTVLASLALLNEILDQSEGEFGA